MITERSREIPFLLSHAIGARNALDIGAAGSKYLAALSQTVHQVIAIDTRKFSLPYGVQGFVRDAAHLPDNWSGVFDFVSCISVLDHVGLEAYGNNFDEGELPRMISEIGRVTHAGGKLIATAPVGKSQLTTHPNGGQRVFDPFEFMKLCDGAFEIREIEYWKLVNDDYLSVSLPEVINAIYLGSRAAACMGVEWIRL